MMFQQPMQKPSSESSDSLSQLKIHIFCFKSFISFVLKKRNNELNASESAHVAYAYLIH